MPAPHRCFGALRGQTPRQFAQSNTDPVEPMPSSTHRALRGVSPLASTINRTTTRSDPPPSSTNRTTTRSNPPGNPSSATSTRSDPSKPPSSRASQGFTRSAPNSRTKNSPPPTFPATRPNPARLVVTDGLPRQQIKQGDEVMATIANFGDEKLASEALARVKPQLA